MKKIYHIFIVAALMIIAPVISSYQLPDSLSQSLLPLIVSQKIDEDVKEYYAERLRICKLDALTKAEDFVDSIIINKISLSVLKGIKFPIRPARPKSPATIKLDDTTKIIPVLKK
jgi:hypothetical protein